MRGVGCVDRVYSDLAIIDITADGLLVTAMVEGLDREELRAKTSVALNFVPNCDALKSFDQTA